MNKQEALDFINLNNVLFLNLVIPKLNIKSINASYWPYFKFNPDPFKNVSIGNISLLIKLLASTYVIFIPEVTFLVCPYPIVHTLAGHLYAVNLQPSNCFIFSIA